MESTATGALTKAHAKATEAFFKIPLTSAKQEKNHTISEMLSNLLLKRRLNATR